jgi:GTP-binding protein EngB required for normal cell division
LRESDKNGKYVLKKLEVYIEKEGLDAALKHLKEDLDNWRNEPFKLAVTGKSGVGKSSFINAIRNLKLGDPGFAATSCSGNTTKHPTVYEYAGNPKITLHELPGFGTTICSENEYKEIMDLSRYDCFLSKILKKMILK